MLYLQEIHLVNFRHFRDVKLNFSEDPERPLTVIRSENGFGKTTLLKAFQWALAGDVAISKDFRMSPDDWDKKLDGGLRCEIKVKLRVKVFDSIEQDRSKIYDIERRRSEELTITKTSHEVKEVSSSTLKVTEISEEGALPVKDAEFFLRKSVFPPEQINTFFVDGDDSESFIFNRHGTPGEKSKRIIESINSLLQLELLENSKGRIRKVINVKESSLAKLDKKGDYSEKLDVVTYLKEEIEKKEDAKRTEDTNEDTTQIAYEKTEEAIRKALDAGGNKANELKEKRNGIQRDLKKLPKSMQDKFDEMRDSFSSPDLAKELIHFDLKSLRKKLGKMETEGVIPETLPEVLRESINKKVCICGQDASPGTAIHTHLKGQLDKLSTDKELTELWTHLNNSTKAWMSSYEEKSEKLKPSGILGSQKSDYAGFFKKESELKRDLEIVNDEIKNLPESDYDGLLEQQNALKQALVEIRDRQLDLASDIGHFRAQHEEAEKLLLKIEHTGDKEKTILLEKTIAEDLEEAIKRTLDTLQTEVIEQVSQKMNELFLRMIQHEDKESGISEAKIARDDRGRHLVEVIAKSGARYSISTDISGAQRRALTIAFILGLVLESGTKAPLLIDTPVGVASGKVRSEMVYQSVINSQQSIIFFTRSEIQGVESIIDKFCGRTHTITKSDMYPQVLKNDNRQDWAEILVCDCDHKSHCNNCEISENHLAQELQNT